MLASQKLLSTSLRPPIPTTTPEQSKALFFSLVLVVFLLRVRELPAFGLVEVVDLPLHIAEELILNRRQLPVPPQHTLVTGDEHIQPNQLPLRYALRLLDIGE